MWSISVHLRGGSINHLLVYSPHAESPIVEVTNFQFESFRPLSQDSLSRTKLTLFMKRAPYSQHLYLVKSQDNAKKTYDYQSCASMALKRNNSFVQYSTWKAICVFWRLILGLRGGFDFDFSFSICSQTDRGSQLCPDLHGITRSGPQSHGQERDLNAW